MSEPTAYDLIQDEKIAEHSSLLQVSDVAPAGSQRSYPAVGQPMSDSMWAWITTGMGNGVISYGGAAYWLSDPDNTDNTFKLSVSRDTGTANAIVAGYFHELTEDIRIKFPPVTKETVYHLCLTFDPLLSQSATGPVTLQVYAGTPPTNGGKRHVLLWTVTRKPNTVMTLGDRKKYRPRLAPTQYIDTDGQLPVVDTQMWGSTYISLHSGKIWVAHGREGDDNPSYWFDATHGGSYDIGWEKLYFSPDSQWAKSSAMARISGNQVFLTGDLVRKDGIAAGQSYPAYTTGMPERFRPKQWEIFLQPGSLYGNDSRNYGNAPITIIISPDGELNVSNAYGTKSVNKVRLSGSYLITEKG